MNTINIIPVAFENQGWAACTISETLSPYFQTEAQAFAWINSHENE